VSVAVRMLGSALDTVSGGLNRVAEWLIAVLLALMTLVTGVAIAGRFLFGYSLFWSDEVTRFLLIWVAFLGMSVGVRRGAHPGIDSLVRALPPAVAPGVLWVALAASSIFFLIMIVYGTSLAQTAWLQRSPSLGLSMSLPYAAVPVAGALMLLHGLAVGGRADRAGKRHE
jgi:TRAP-type C4-dicarboxylate transport system permease small subunit